MQWRVFENPAHTGQIRSREIPVPSSPLSSSRSRSIRLRHFSRSPRRLLLFYYYTKSRKQGDTPIGARNLFRAKSSYQLRRKKFRAPAQRSASDTLFHASGMTAKLRHSNSWIVRDRVSVILDIKFLTATVSSTFQGDFQIPL